MASLFQNAKQAQHYAAARPSYPASLYRRIVGLCPHHSTAVDIGCGTGQATVTLAAHFDSVVGIDPSPAQLASAEPHERVTYRTGEAVEALTTFPNQSISLITAAQSAHWLDLPSFYEQVHRVLQPNGVLAIWVYAHLKCEQDARLERMIRHDLYEVKLEPKYWDPRRRMVESLYADLPTMDQFHSDVKTAVYEEGGDHDISKEVLAGELLEYLRSWSGYNNFRQDNPDAEDPLLELEEYCLENIGTRKIRVVWPLRLLVSVKSSDDSK